MLKQDDILLGQLALARGLITLPNLLHSITLVTENQALGDILIRKGHMSFLDMEELVEDLQNQSDTDLTQELESGQTLILSEIRQTQSGNRNLVETISSAPEGATTIRVLSEALLNTQATLDRYEFVEMLGKGGMGHVWKALDRVMQREVALKLLAPHFGDDPDLQHQLMLEAQVTGLLEHPSIIPIYELGNLADNGPYYAMRIVREPNLQSIIDEMSKQRDPIRSLSQLITILRTALLALQYAHDHGVIHRDLKPENILVGSYGEVFIIDWGVAKIDNAKLQHPGMDRGAFPLQPGTLVGTPHYMAPEQARGDNHLIDERSDVYAMGVILYELLTLKTPFDTNNILSLLFQVSEEKPTPPSLKAPDRQIPLTLEEICLKALAKNPKERYQSALEMASELELYLEGVKDRQRREELVEAITQKANDQRHQYNKTRAIHAQSVGELFALQRTVQSHAPIEEKQPLWELQQRCDNLLMETEQHFSETALLYGQALSHLPQHEASRKALADLYWERFIEAEIARDDASATHFEGLVRQYNDGQYDTLLAGHATLSLIVEPQIKATVTLYQYQRQMLKLAPIEQHRTLTPVDNYRLPHGSYLLTVEAPGYIPLRVPVQLRRLQEQHIKLRMYPVGTVPEEMIIISDGPFLSGRIEAATIDKHIKSLSTFAIMRYPVTCGDYLSYLNDRSWHDFETALQHAPRLEVEQNTKIYFDHNNAQFSIPTEDAEGDAWHPDWPICLITYDDVLDYARWRSAHSDFTYRLPTMFEWEKAARGVDGRLYPWGNHFDAAFCNVRDSQRGRAMPVPVGTYAHDCSPYGVLDMAGNVAEWTSTPDPKEDTSFILQGSAYALPSFAARLDWNFSAPKSFCYPTYGFRLVFDLS